MFSRPRCTVRTSRSLCSAGLGALYGPEVPYVQPASVNCTDLKFLMFSRRRCTVGPQVPYVQLASVHCTDLKFLILSRPRCTLRTSNSLCSAGLGAFYGLQVPYVQSASVHFTDLKFLMFSRPRCNVRTSSSLCSAGLGAPNFLNEFDVIEDLNTLSTVLGI